MPLYTLIPTELGLEGIEYWIMRKRGLIPQHFTKKFILISIEFLLKNNNFSFDFKMFDQIFGKLWAQNVLLHMHVSSLAIKKKLNCLRKGYQIIFPMKSV